MASFAAEAHACPDGADAKLSLLAAQMEATMQIADSVIDFGRVVGELSLKQLSYGNFNQRCLASNSKQTDSTGLRVYNGSHVAVRFLASQHAAQALMHAVPSSEEAGLDTIPPSERQLRVVELGCGCGSLSIVASNALCDRVSQLTVTDGNAEALMLAEYNFLKYGNSRQARGYENATQREDSQARAPPVVPAIPVVVDPEVAPVPVPTVTLTEAEAAPLPACVPEVPATPVPVVVPAVVASVVAAASVPLVPAVPASPSVRFDHFLWGQADAEVEHLSHTAAQSSADNSGEPYAVLHAARRSGETHRERCSGAASSGSSAGSPAPFDLVLACELMYYRVDLGALLGDVMSLLGYPSAAVAEGGAGAGTAGRGLFCHTHVFRGADRQEQQMVDYLDSRGWDTVEVPLHTFVDRAELLQHPDWLSVRCLLSGPASTVAHLLRLNPQWVRFQESPCDYEAFLESAVEHTCEGDSADEDGGSDGLMSRLFE